MSLLNEIEKYLQEETKEVPVLTDDDLAKSCYGLVKYNNGLYKSDKQGWFFKGRVKKGKHQQENVPEGTVGIIKSNFSGKYGITWKYVIDNEGVVQQIKQKYTLKKGKTKAQVDREYDAMSFRSRERNWGLQGEEMQDEWVNPRDIVMWERKDNGDI